MIRLLIADDHPIVREGLKRIIADCADILLVGEAVNGEEVLDLCSKLEIDVILLDISMPGPGFIDVLNRLELKYPRIHVLVLSMHSEDHYAIRAIKAGADGYLTKNHSPEELATAIRHVYQGNRYVTPSLGEKLASMLKTSTDNPLHEALSNREYQILCLIGSGNDTRDIASKLSLSPKTVSTYRTRIFDKMGFKANSELIRYAIEHNLVE
jgi:two-component system, NarL family, invasion response regulator UvrY